MLVWEESLGWNNSAKQMADPDYFRLQVEQTRAMVRASFNHPSVIIFAFQNENASQTQEGKKMNDALIAAIKAEDDINILRDKYREEAIENLFMKA